MKKISFVLLSILLVACYNTTKVDEASSNPTIHNDLVEDSVPMSYDEVLKQVEASDNDSNWLSTEELIAGIQLKAHKHEKNFAKYKGDEMLKLYSNFYDKLKSSNGQENNKNIPMVYDMMETHLNRLTDSTSIQITELIKISSIKSDINTWFAKTKSLEVKTE